MKKTLFFLYIFCISLSINAQEQTLPFIERQYVQNPYVTPEVWAKVAPYFLPSDHPAKAALDEIFSAQRVLLSRDTALAAGFTLTSHQGLQATVMEHPRIPNYIIKVYFDNKVIEKQEWEHWIKRIEGTKAIQSAIKKRKYGSLFVVPKKWIYPLPTEPSPPADGSYVRKNFVLIAEKMPILDMRENKLKYRSSMTRAKLKKLFEVVTDAGMYDSVRPGNVPWTTKRQLAFVDTEVYNQWPIDYHPMLEFIPSDKRPYWQSLYKK